MNVCRREPDLINRVLDKLADAKVGQRGELPPEKVEAWSHWREGMVRAYDKFSAAEQLVDVYERLIEPTLIDPCFVTHVPSVVIPLAQ